MLAMMLALLTEVPRPAPLNEVLVLVNAHPDRTPYPPPLVLLAKTR
jgi:hypothetical protein